MYTYEIKDKKSTENKHQPLFTRGASSDNRRELAICFYQLELGRYLACLVIAHKDKLQRLICVITLTRVGAQRLAQIKHHIVQSVYPTALTDMIM